MLWKLRTAPQPKREIGHRRRAHDVRRARLRAPAKAREHRELGRERERTSEMPKMKTKSGAKKRFKMTGTGKVKVAASGKRHGMIKRHAKFIRNARGTMVLDDCDAKIVKKYMPYAR
jgi:large subunit ribosomal protein L35